MIKAEIKKSARCGYTKSSTTTGIRKSPKMACEALNPLISREVFDLLVNTYPRMKNMNSCER